MTGAIPIRFFHVSSHQSMWASVGTSPDPHRGDLSGDEVAMHIGGKGTTVAVLISFGAHADGFLGTGTEGCDFIFAIQRRG